MNRMRSVRAVLNHAARTDGWCISAFACRPSRLASGLGPIYIQREREEEKNRDRDRQADRQTEMLLHRGPWVLSQFGQVVRR